jgi:hypothetical protein
VARCEANWIDMVEQRPGAGRDEDGYTDGFALGPDETLVGALAELDQVAARTAEVIRATDLGAEVPVPQGVPWFPADVESWSVRWVLLHLVEEIARHAGHADIVRERSTAPPATS